MHIRTHAQTHTHTHTHTHTNMHTYHSAKHSIHLILHQICHHVMQTCLLYIRCHQGNSSLPQDSSRLNKAHRYSIFFLFQQWVLRWAHVFFRHQSDYLLLIVAVWKEAQRSMSDNPALALTSGCNQPSTWLPDLMNSVSWLTWFDLHSFCMSYIFFLSMFDYFSFFPLGLLQWIRGF